MTKGLVTNGGIDAIKNGNDSFQKNKNKNDSLQKGNRLSRHY